MTDAHRRRLFAPIAVGELIDKITILELKLERIGDPRAAENVARELALLRDVRAEARLDEAELQNLAAELRDINAELWNIEDEIRDLEARGDFGPRFVATARRVYHMNDRRAAVKRRINAVCGSDIVEEKSYRGR